MKIIISNIKSMFRNNGHFAVMIILTVLTGCFSVCFSIALLGNNRYKQMEDELDTRTIYANFTAEISYGENEKIFREMSDIFGSALQEITFMYSAAGKENEKGLLISAVADRNYQEGESQSEIEYQICEGRNLCNEDFAEGRRVALVTAGYEEKTVTIGEEEYEVVGKRDLGEFVGSGDSGIMVMLPITAWGDLPLNYISFRLERIPTYTEYLSFKSLLEENFSGMYYIDEYGGDDADVKALYRTITAAVAGIMSVVLVTVMFLMGYVYESRRYRMTVYRLTGCSRKKAFIYLLGEAAFVTIPSGALGIIVFAILRKICLDDYYVYIETMFDLSLYVEILLAVSALVLLEITVMSLRLVSGSLKDELTEVRG